MKFTPIFLSYEFVHSYEHKNHTDCPGYPGFRHRQRLNFRIHGIPLIGEISDAPIEIIKGNAEKSNLADQPKSVFIS
jgi:hypothetical protein